MKLSEEQQRLLEITMSDIDTLKKICKLRAIRIKYTEKQWRQLYAPVLKTIGKLNRHKKYICPMVNKFKEINKKPKEFNIESVNKK